MKTVIKILQETLGAPSASGSGWTGFYVFGVGAGMPNVPSAPTSWPYRTATAERVWAEVIKLIPRHPEMSEGELLRKAIGNIGVRALDLAPEDWRLLEMAIEWRKNGIKSVKLPRTGGLPGPHSDQSARSSYVV